MIPSNARLHGALRAGLVIAGLMAAPTALAGDPSAPSPSETDMKAAVYKMLDTDSTTVSFAPGSAELSPSDRSSLKALVQKAQGAGQGGDILVASWSDRDYPARGQKLEKKDRDLAARRNDAVEQELKTDGAKTVTAYSFAEHPDWLSKVLHRSGAEVKGEGKVKSDKDQELAQLGQRLRQKGGPSSSVVLLRPEGVSSH